MPLVEEAQLGPPTNGRTHCAVREDLELLRLLMSSAVKGRRREQTDVVCPAVESHEGVDVSGWWWRPG